MNSLLKATRQPLQPANPAANVRVAELLSYLGALRTERLVLSGQFTNFGSRASLREVVRIRRAVGRTPALVGVDYANFRFRKGRRLTTQQQMNAISLNRTDLVLHSDLDLRAPNRVALAHWRKGGLVTVGAHFFNPANPAGGGLRDQGVDLERLLKRGTPTHRRWIDQLDRLAEGLGELRDAGVVVLWRPFHEMNGGWFWWGASKPATFARVWRHMFRYFSREKGLDNLLWVYGPNHGDNAADYYPGDAWVDVVGLDAYTDHVDPVHIRGYEALSRLGKPFGFTEFGPHGPAHPTADFDYRRLGLGLASFFPRACFFMSWNAEWNPASNRNARAFLRNPRIVNLEDLPPGLAWGRA